MKNILFILPVVFLLMFSCSTKKCVGGSLDGKTCEDIYTDLCILSNVGTTYQNIFKSSCESGGGYVK